jgi:hypothetical protein
MHARGKWALLSISQGFPPFLVNRIKQHIRSTKKICLESTEQWLAVHMRRRKKLTAKSGLFRKGKKDDSNSFVMFQPPVDQQVTARPGR